MPVKQAVGQIPAQSLKTKTLALSEFEPGDYRFVVNLRERGSAQVAASSNAGFQIRESRKKRKLFVAGSKTGAMPAVAAYLRALACIAQKNAALAEEYLRKAIEAQPANGEAVRMLASLYFQRREYEHVAALYRRSGAGLFTEYPESVAQVALSLSKIGDARSAVGLLTEGTRRFPDDRSLALVASQMASAAPRR